MAANQYAISGAFRSGTARSGTHSSRVYITIAGTERQTDVHMASLEIEQVLREEPDTCRFTIGGVKPTVGQEVVITLGTVHNLRRLFAGHIIGVRQHYLADNPHATANTAWACSCVDYTWQLGFRHVTRLYAARSATEIAIDLITTFAPEGFTTAGIAAGLPTVDEISFTDVPLPEAMTRLMNRVGGYWRPSYHRDIRAWIGDEPGVVAPRPVEDNLPSLRDVQHHRDLGQLVTRAIVEGGGGTSSAMVLPGDTSIPVDEASWYAPDGGAVRVGQQDVSYDALVLGGYGALVGPSTSPLSGPSVSPHQPGSGIDVGVHGWAFTWVTASGETLPSPVRSATILPPITAPTHTPTVTQGPDSIGSLYAIGDTIEYFYTYSTTAFYAPEAASESTPSDPVEVEVVGSLDYPTLCAKNRVTVQHSPDPEVRMIRLWANVNNEGVFRLARSIANNGTTALEAIPDIVYPPGGDLEHRIALPATTRGQQATVFNISPGPTGTIARKVYRTEAGGSQLKLHSTIANNSTSQIVDATPDSSLGSNAPTSNTSGLVSSAGQVLPGATSLPTSGAFDPGGGWVIVGSGQLVRYTGVSGTTLTGIPESGVGAITAAISYGSTVAAAPALVGIPTEGDGAIVVAIDRGTQVNLFAQADNYSAQAELAALVGGDGVREARLQDNRLSYAEALTRAQALLEQLSEPIDTLDYSVRDLMTEAGPNVTVSLSPPTDLSGTFRIQRVILSEFERAPKLFPRRTVQASSLLFTFEDLLRQARNG